MASSLSLTPLHAPSGDPHGQPPSLPGPPTNQKLVNAYKLKFYEGATVDLRHGSRHLLQQRLKRERVREERDKQVIVVPCLYLKEKGCTPDVRRFLSFPLHHACRRSTRQQHPSSPYSHNQRRDPGSHIHIQSLSTSPLPLPIHASSCCTPCNIRRDTSLVCKGPYPSPPRCAPSPPQLLIYLWVGVPLPFPAVSCVPCCRRKGYTMTSL